MTIQKQKFMLCDIGDSRSGFAEDEILLGMPIQQAKSRVFALQMRAIYFSETAVTCRYHS
jgi:hypothetical protein